MAKKEREDGQLEFDFPSRRGDTSDKKKPRTVDDLPDVSPTLSFAVRQRYEQEASNRGVELKVLKYAVDTYGQDFEVFLEAYRANGSLDVADTVMHISEA